MNRAGMPRSPQLVEPDLPAALTAIGQPTFVSDMDLENVLATSTSSDRSPSADAEHVAVTGSRLVGLRLTGSTFDHLRLLDVVAEDCELSGAVLSNATFQRVQLIRCRMSGLVAAGLQAQDVRIVDCKLDDANLRMSSWERCQFVGSDLRDADFYEARFTQCGLLQSSLQGAQFSRASLDSVALHGSNLDGIRGADALTRVVIGSEQVLPLALAVFAARGIEVDDDPH